ncbi:hypothetical protein DVH26_24420 [Paenibacillus sp. H1-7]|uniref:endolytic transglycosylase MltG n=1 Tax=Paenibacillus sp. H1-7 TaxID=2282849 RepID=UPI001EF94EC5|nr:endolytic transglycosylase MltG [Paenibacillus sp. H1-7]ULL17310.1 hypothetical protein DVH26_24420 [Paenibacillus sp. H1-7]
MLKNKAFLIGTGGGLIAGALLLQLMSVTVPPVSRASAGADPQAMNPQQLKEAAAGYFQVFEKDQKLYNQAQADALVQQKLKEAASQAAQPVKETVQEATYIYISKGMTAGNVADLLVQSGVISDRKAFEDAMLKQQLNDKIVAGVHAFKGPQDLPQVLANITSK